MSIYKADFYKLLQQMQAMENEIRGIIFQVRSIIQSNFSDDWKEIAKIDLFVATKIVKEKYQCSLSEAHLIISESLNQNDSPD